MLGAVTDGGMVLASGAIYRVSHTARTVTIVEPADDYGNMVLDCRCIKANNYRYIWAVTSEPKL
jgi:hypothetical protein